MPQMSRYLVDLTRTTCSYNFDTKTSNKLHVMTNSVVIAVHISTNVLSRAFPPDKGVQLFSLI